MELLTQTEARRQAQELRAKGIPAIARAFPAGSWGGSEKGWVVDMLSDRELVSVHDMRANLWTVIDANGQWAIARWIGHAIGSMTYGDERRGIAQDAYGRQQILILKMDSKGQVTISTTHCEGLAFP